MKYRNAPVSEVVVGVSFKTSVFSDDDLFQINTMLNKEYPSVEMMPPLNLEILNGYQLQVGFDIATSGQVLYRRRSVNREWLVQIQQNKIYLNWIRADSDPVGSYPGFSIIINKFFELMSVLSTKLNKDLSNNIVLFDLTYHDRFSWQDYIKDLTEINTILDLSIPKILDEENNNIFSKFVYPLKQLNGFGIISINTVTSPETMKQILTIETSLRGFDTDIKTWFDKAHNLQTCIFENLFRESIKNKWIVN